MESTVQSPTAKTYEVLDNAYNFFNKELFGGTLPHCLITLQRHKKAYGYFCFESFGNKDNKKTDEIALNPGHFQRPVDEIISTLVHEMAHLWQYHEGKHSRNGYHNREWGTKMKSLGLMPSSTGAPGGKETGQKVSHYIDPQGLYAKHFAEWVKQYEGLTLFYDITVEDKKETKGKKIKYTCEGCDVKAWGKPGLNIQCGECIKSMKGE